MFFCLGVKMESSVLLKRSQIINLSSQSLMSETAFPDCRLKWKQKILWVKKAVKGKDALLLPSVKNEQWLTDCLRHSLVRIVCLDRELGEQGILFWANACQKSGKKVALRITSGVRLKKSNTFNEILKRAFDWLVAFALLFVFSPVFLILVLFIRLTSSKPLFSRQWRVGKGGQLFQILEFSSMTVNAQKKYYQVRENKVQKSLTQRQIASPMNDLGNWMCKYGLDRFPQLINILRGQMSFVGPQSWTIHDALQLESQRKEQRKEQLNTLPGIIGVWPISILSN